MRAGRDNDVWMPVYAELSASVPSSMNISLKQLKCFVAVAQQQSFTRAAESLHTTQSAVSLMIKELEEEVGFRLFDRTTRQVLLSSSGEVFFKLASRLLDEFQTVLRDASDIATLRRGVVRVGATEAVACSLAVPAIAAYQKLHPRIDVQLVVTLVPTMFQALSSRDVDFIVGPDSIEGEDIDRSITAEELARSPIWLWCQPEHRLALGDDVLWRATFEHDLIVPALDFTTRMLPSILAHLGVPGGSDLVHGGDGSRRPVGNITAAFSMAQAGLGVTFAAAYTRPLATAFGLTGRPLVGPVLERVLMLYMRSGRVMSPAANNFLEYFRDHVRSVKMI